MASKSLAAFMILSGIIGPQIIDLEGRPVLSAFPLPNFIDTIQEGTLTYIIPQKLPWARLVYRFKYLPSVIHRRDRGIQNRDAIRSFSSIRMTTILPRPAKDGARNDSKPFEAGWVNGSAYVAKRELINLIGEKDPNLFAYAEEADWSIKAKRLGYKTIFYPGVSIIHIGSASSSQSYKLVCDRAESSYRERLYFSKKHFSPLAYQAIKFWLFAELWAKYLLRETLTWQEPKRSEYLRAYSNSLDYLCGKKDNRSRNIKI